MPIRLTELPADPEAPFPPVETALRDPDGLLAWGGDLAPARLLNAYAHGCFPWYERGQPILWWSPDPRMTLATAGFHVSRSLARFLRRSDWTLTADRHFEAVVAACASIARRGQRGTWITGEMRAAYGRLHELGHAHSVEAVDAEGELVGGVYGIAVGRMFFGESMFSGASNASKTALLGLCRFLADNGMPLLDCQMETAHLASLGARLEDRAAFLAQSRSLCALPAPTGSWNSHFGVIAARRLIRRDGDFR